MSSQTPPNVTRKRRPLLVAFLIVVALLIVFSSLSGVYTDILWFNQLGFGQVFTTNLVAKILTFVVPALVMWLATWGSLALAYRNRPIYVRSANANLAQFSDVFTQLRRAIVIGVPALLGLFAGVAVSSSWSIILTWLNRSYTGTKDPQFGMDIGFYLFDVPFFRLAVTFISALIMLSLLLTVAVNLAFGGIRFTGLRGALTRPARLQIGILAAAYFAAQAFSLWLDQFSTISLSSDTSAKPTLA